MLLPNLVSVIRISGVGLPGFAWFTDKPRLLYSDSTIPLSVPPLSAEFLVPLQQYGYAPNTTDPHKLIELTRKTIAYTQVLGSFGHQPKVLRTSLSSTRQTKVSLSRSSHSFALCIYCLIHPASSSSSSSYSSSYSSCSSSCSSSSLFSSSFSLCQDEDVDTQIRHLVQECHSCIKNDWRFLY